MAGVLACPRSAFFQKRARARAIRQLPRASLPRSTFRGPLYPDRIDGLPSQGWRLRGK